MSARRGIPDDELLALITDLRAKRDTLTKVRREESRVTGVKQEMNDEEREVRLTLMNLESRRSRRITLAKLRGIKK